MNCVCGCSSFIPQLYRQGACLRCFHTIDQHDSSWVIDGHVFRNKLNGKVIAFASIGPKVEINEKSSVPALTEIPLNEHIVSTNIDHWNQKIQASKTGPVELSSKLDVSKVDLPSAPTATPDMYLHVLDISTFESKIEQTHNLPTVPPPQASATGVGLAVEPTVDVNDTLSKTIELDSPKLLESTSPSSSVHESNQPVSIQIPSSTSSVDASLEASPKFDTRAFTGPVYGNPLLIDLNDSKFTNGVLRFRVSQPYDEGYIVEHTLLVTPFTIMAVAEHPRIKSFYVLKWERSLLSLRNLFSQPIFNSIESAISMGVAAAAAKSQTLNASSDPSLKPQMKFKTFFGARPQQQKEQKDLSKPSVVIGLLASFAAENSETIPFLRTYRAGKRPVTKSGFLSKKKRGNWREHVPLGPLGWKKRWFVLEPTRILYYSNPPSSDSSNAPPKGIIPLEGWVDVMFADSLGSTNSTFHKHDFVVRTGSTFHVFSASSETEASDWMDAITINSLHLGTSNYDPQTIIFRTIEEANNISSQIAQRRDFLVQSMKDASQRELYSPGGLYQLVQDTQIQVSQPRVPLSNQLFDDRMFAEILTLAQASGGLTDEFLSQLPLATSTAVRRRLQTLDRATMVPTAQVEKAWFYLDDFDKQQGPFPERAMRQWFLDGYFNSNTLLKFAVPVPSFDKSCMIDERNCPLIFLPLGILFQDDVSSAFNSNWEQKYVSEIKFQSLVSSAAELELDMDKVFACIISMKSKKANPDIDTLLNFMNE
jgi:PH domain/GYF domain